VAINVNKEIPVLNIKIKEKNTRPFLIEHNGFGSLGTSVANILSTIINNTNLLCQ